MSNTCNIMVPIELESGKTIWHKIGVLFENPDKNKKYIASISIQSLPLQAMTKGEIRAFIFPFDGGNKQKNDKMPIEEPPFNFADYDMPF